MRRERSKLTDEQSRRLTEHFVAGTPARTAAELVGVNRNTARLFYHRVRELIAQRLAHDNPFDGEPLEVAESEVEQRTSHRSASKMPVFALLKHGGKVYTAMVLQARAETPPAQPARFRPDAIVYADPPTAGDVLGVSRFQHRRVHHRGSALPPPAGIDSIENFWNQAKRHMRRYNGIPRRHLHLFVKECEWRFNYGSPKQLLVNLKYWTRSRRTAR
jgi:transposase